MSIFIEEIAKSDSSKETGLMMSSSDQEDDADDVIESLTLCQYSFIFAEIFKSPLKVNGGVLSIDSIYRYDNDERSKKIEFEIKLDSVFYVKITDVYNQMKELDISMLTSVPSKKASTEDDIKIVASKRADQKMKSITEKSVEIQKFVKPGKYFLDFTKSVFDLNTDLFPCNRIRMEIEIRPLKDIPQNLKTLETCSSDAEISSSLPVELDNFEYDKKTRIDGYFPITENVIKKFKFHITEPTFLIFLTSFEKELSGGSMTLSISHVQKMKSTQKSDKMGILPIYFSSETSDGISFLHYRLEPGLSGDRKLFSAAGDYVLTLSGGHKANLTKTLETNKQIPRCSKVSIFYQLIKISEIKDTFDEEFLAETGEIDTDGNN
jgi:hypothetical protein